MKSNTLIFLFFVCTTAIAQSNVAAWESVSKEGNIEVYTRKMAGEAYKEIRVEATFNGSLEKLQKALDTAESYKEWVYKCTVAKKLKTINEQEFYYYVESDLPFPVSNRDLIVHSKKRKDKNNIYYQSKAVTEFMPSEKGIVRIEEYESSWKITPQAGGSMAIVYECKTNPGGALPAWLVNLAVTTGPLKTMQRLEVYIKEDESKGQRG